MGNQEEKMTVEEKKDLITGCSNNVYKFFENNDFLVNTPTTKIKETPTKNEESYSSLQFAPTIELMVRTCLNNTFDITLNENLFHQAAFGGGNELCNLTTLHSSALAALLCFHNVEGGEIKINIGHEDKTFNHVKFEHENKVTYAYCGINKSVRRAISNIDVALSNFPMPQKTDGSDNVTGVVLFLESKFSEYLELKASADMSDAYNVITGSLNLDELGLEHTSGKLKTNNNEEHYLDGIKQMICHFMGACEYAKNHRNQQVYLGSILFKFPYQIDKGAFVNYSQLYTKLIVELQRLNKTCTNLHLLSTPLTYQQVFSFPANNALLDVKVKQYYKLSLEDLTLPKIETVEK